MANRLVAMMIPLIAACSSKGGGAGVVDQTSGTVTMGGKPLAITSCKATIGDHGKSTLELALDNGLTLINDPRDGLIASTDQARMPLTCDRVGGSMSSGVAGKAAWAEGALQATCHWSSGDLVIDVTYDCGSTRRPSNRSARPKPPTTP
jgi:hypothetical protein